jgi:hypothetical protein
MRALVLVFGLLGAAGAGMNGVSLFVLLKKFEPDPTLPAAAVARLPHLRNAMYGMLAAVPLGFVAVGLGLTHKRVVAVVLFFLAYAAATAGFFAKEAKLNPLMVFVVPCGFLLAASVALSVPPKGIRAKGNKGTNDDW